MTLEDDTDARTDAAVMHADIFGELQRRANLRSYYRKSTRTSLPPLCWLSLFVLIF